ncbi:MAG: hypothetical protein DME08_14200 [Candidatus Rokuibacteriota bacterium]|nr:MAG: hypothetical protein DME08_14200 [Candidatus Rokubacteria bacterium]
MERPIAYDKLAREERFVRKRARDIAELRMAQGLSPMADLASRESIRERVHGILVGELQAMEGAGRTVCDFPDAPWEFTLDMARQVWDESRHVEIYLGLLEYLGGYVGEFAESTILWRCACAEDAAARVAGVNRGLEGLACDVFNQLIHIARKIGDPVIERAVDFVLADEITHVRMGSRWLNELTKGDPDRRRQAIAFQETIGDRQARPQHAALSCLLTGRRERSPPGRHLLRRGVGPSHPQLSLRRGADDAHARRLDRPHPRARAQAAVRAPRLGLRSARRSLGSPAPRVARARPAVRAGERPLRRLHGPARRSRGPPRDGRAHRGRLSRPEATPDRDLRSSPGRGEPGVRAADAPDPRSLPHRGAPSRRRRDGGARAAARQRRQAAGQRVADTTPRRAGRLRWRDRRDADAAAGHRGRRHRWLGRRRVRARGVRSQRHRRRPAADPRGALPRPHRPRRRPPR